MQRYILNAYWLDFLGSLKRSVGGVTYFLLYVRLPKTPNQYTSTLKMAIVVCVEHWITFNVVRGSSLKAEVVVVVFYAI
jgi:hypothetical protein